MRSLLFFMSFLCLTLLSSKLEAHSAHFNFEFSVDNQGWQGDFTDYPVGEESFYELAWGWTTLPAELFIDGHLFTKGLFLSGNNHSDDLFMFVRRQVSGLKPHTHYDLTFHVTIENNIPPGQFGIGGSPGESVYFKVGASAKEPQKFNQNGFYQLNVDKGNQAQGGKNAIVVGNLANPLVDPNHPTYQPKQYVNEVPLKVKTDHKGQIWLFVGTDSGFEGPTLYYIADIAVHAKKTPNSDE